MQVQVEYVAQMRDAAGVDRENVAVSAGSTIRDLVAALAERHPEKLADLLFSEDGVFRSSALLFLGDSQVAIDDEQALTEGCTLTLLAPLAGG